MPTKSNNDVLRRRSIINRAVLNTPHVENDDEAERSELLAADSSKGSAQFSTPRSADTPRSAISVDFTSSPQKEHIQGCLKLYTENKINKENAWNLRLIDYMSSMLRKHDSQMENLQVASTTLDASTKIYSYRVDGVHHDVLKMAGGLSKAVQSKRGKKPEDEENVDPNATVNEGGVNAEKKKRKKTAKSSIASNIESLNAEIEINECIDPFFAQLAATTGDTTSSNRAFNATLPVDDKTLGILLNSDVPFLNLNESEEENLNLENLEVFNLRSNLVRVVTKDDNICEPFHGFCITDWDPEEEEEQIKTQKKLFDDNLNLSQQAVAFDMNADVEPLPEEEVINNFIYGDEFQNAVDSDEEEMGVTHLKNKRDHPKLVARLVDMRPSTQSDGFLEYSYSSAVIGAWAGPAHWKLKNNINKLARLSERHQTITTVMVKKGPSRKKKLADFLNEGMSYNRLVTKCPEYGIIIPAKIMIGRKTLSQGTTWNDKKFKTPIDKGFNMSHFKKLNLQQQVMLDLPSDKKLEAKKNGFDGVIDVNDYEYDNDNDNSYCPNSQPDNDYDEPLFDEACDKEGDIHNQFGVDNNGLEMIEPPPKVAKIFIPYAMRAKKVDMKQLKHVTWKFLTNQYDSNTGGEKPNVAIEENVKEINFSSLFKKLPTKLSNNMKESLSVSLSLLAVLHLANDKGLSLVNNSNYTDFSIAGL